MTIKAIIFDRDGVLTNFDTDKAEAYFKPLLPVNIEEISNYWDTWGQKQGFPKNIAEEAIFWKNFWEDFCQHFQVSPQVKEKLIKINYTEFMFAYPEARETLSALYASKVKIGVLSNFTLASLEASLSDMKLMEFIDIAHTAINIGVSKPHPEAYLIMTNALQVSPQECLFFDDEIDNVKGAEKFGMHAYYVKRSQSHHDFEHRIICDLTPVLTLLEKYNKKND